MPRQGLFFPLFERHAEVLVAGARALREMLNGGGELSGLCGKVMAQEQKADDITREVHLEESVDRFDDVGNEIQGIVIEHV